MPLMTEQLTTLDMDDIELSIKMDLDFLFISNVRTESIIKEIRKIVSK